jgi:DNA-binding Xre family transcriptional regulator
MGISFRPLWKVLVDRDMKKIDLKTAANISSPTLAKLAKNQNVDISTVVKICAALSCQPGEIMEYIPPRELSPPGKAPPAPGSP